MADFRMCSGLSGSPLHETIPGFHDARERFERFKKAVEEDVCGGGGFSPGGKFQFVLDRKKLWTAFRIC